MKSCLLIILSFLCVRALPTPAFSSQVGHTHDILKVEFNSDATKLISYSAGDGWLCLWETQTGKQIWRTKTEVIQKASEYYTLTSFAFSPDQNLIASGSGNGTVQLWDGKTGKLIWRGDAHKDSVTAVEFSPDGKTIVSAASPKDGPDEIRILRVEDGQLIKRLEGKPCTVIAIKFNKNGKVLETGNLDGNVSEWNLETGKQNDLDSAPPCRLRRTYEWETSFTPDLKMFAMRTGQKELTLKDSQTKAVKKTIAAEDYLIYSRFNADGTKVVVSGYSGFTFYNLTTGETRKIDEMSGTGSTIDLSPDGSLFAEGGSWGKAAIKVTETKTGKSKLLDGHLNGKTVPPYQPTELENRLAKEKMEKQALLNQAEALRDKQAKVDTMTYEKLVYITFEHYGDMADPGEQRMMESDEPKKSKVTKPINESNAVWLRLHNDSPLPIQIPTQSMYMPDPKCFCELSNGKKAFGLCDNREISIWHGLENKKGKPIPYGFDFGSNALLLPKTSVVFAVPREILKSNNAILFGFTFQKETDDNKIDKYGENITLRFRESDLPKN